MPNTYQEPELCLTLRPDPARGTPLLSAKRCTALPRNTNSLPHPRQELPNPEKGNSLSLVQAGQAADFAVKGNINKHIATITKVINPVIGINSNSKKLIPQSGRV